MRYRLIPLWGVCLLGGCLTRQPDRVAMPRPVKIATVEPLTTQEREYVGLATPDDAVNLAFKIGGQVINVPVSKGQAVRRGELIAELDPREVSLEVEADRTAYEEARSQWERMKRLLSHEAISIQEYEASTTRYAQAKSAYESSQTLLQDTRLKAPFDGVIEYTSVDTYERVTAGQTIARLVNPLTRTVSFTLPERALPLLEEPSTHFWVTFDNYPGKRFTAHLKNFARTSANASGFPTSLLIDNPDPALHPITPGMSCSIYMQIKEPHQGVVSIPLSAIYAPTQGGDYVWVVGTDERVEKRAVTLGEPFGRDRITIEKGLQAGDRIVTAGVYRLKEGESVEIIPTE